MNNESVPEGSRGLARIGILVVSDRASRGEYDDTSGTAINGFLNRTIRSNWIAIVKVVPDGVDSVANALVEMSDREGCDLVLTPAALDRMAIREARKIGLRVFGVTIDENARDYFPHIFGRGAYAIIGDVARLPTALPAIYRQITS